MKRVIAGLLCLMILLSAGCSSSEPQTQAAEIEPTPKEEAVLSEAEHSALAQEAVNSIENAINCLADAAELIDSCWYTGAKHGNSKDGPSVNDLLSGEYFSEYFTYREDAAKAVGVWTVYDSLDMSQCVRVALYLLDADGTFAEAQTSLLDAKEKIKELDTSTEIYTILKDYYTDVDALYTQLSSPSGNYSDFASYISTLAKTFNDYRSDIDFEIG